MKLISLFCLSLLVPLIACAASTQINLSIKNDKTDYHDLIIIKKDDITIQNINSDSNNRYSVKIKYKDLPSNRSFPSNLDITISNNNKKVSYLFFALNSLEFLSKMENWGIETRINGELTKFNFSGNKKNTRNLYIDQLLNERIIQDTLASQKNFQMIRPVIMDKLSSRGLSKIFSLDKHPFYVEYKAIQITQGVVEIQFNFYEKINNKLTLLNRVYYQAGSLKVFREAMYAAKYFNSNIGPVKLVFYPAFGQTQP